MMQTSNAIEPNPQENRYPFRSVSSNQLLHLTQPQLARIPYLSALIAHKDHFLSIQNEKGEYLLNDPIEYPSFIAILHSINSNNPYILLDQLSENENVLNTLQLVDYLGLQSCSLPILKDVNLVRTNPDQNEDQRVKYERASLVEARQSAAEFVIGVAKNEYQLDGPNMTNTIFNLMNIILSDSSVFSLSFRCHTLTIVRQCCYSFFSKDQKRQLHSTHRSTLFNKRNPSMYLSDENQAIPINFDNAFTWKSVDVKNDDNHTDSLSSEFNDALHLDTFDALDSSDDDIQPDEIHGDISRYSLESTSTRMELESLRLHLKKELVKIQDILIQYQNDQRLTNLNIDVDQKLKNIDKTLQVEFILCLINYQNSDGFFCINAYHN